MTASSRTARSTPRPGTRPLPARPKPQDDAIDGYVMPEVPGGVIRFTTESEEDRAEKRSVLFTIDDVQYTVLDNPSSDLGLNYLDMSRKMGPLAAVSWAMETMLGKDAYDSLRRCKGLPPKGLQRVVEVVTEKILGSLDDPKDR